ncbi:MAG: ABC transporter ATP-binding protein [Desulfovibrio sp.]|jgi:putative ABC transport system ATP-binding protein|nr:ABC transporter ATP-binding protein [Desulfovibrio sp.]
MLLHARDLRKDFVRGDASFAAVLGASLDMAEGDFITVSGKSGSGKTTLVTMLAGLLRPTAGRLAFDGRDVGSLSDKQLAALRNREIGFVPQGASLLGSYTAFDNVRMPQVFAGKEKTGSDRAAFLLEAVGVGHLADAFPSSLSGGEARRVAIARALFNSPRLLVADEPTGDLDPENSRAIMDFFANVNAQGTAVLIVTHEGEAAKRGALNFAMRAGDLVPLGADSGDDGANGNNRGRGKAVC